MKISVSILTLDFANVEKKFVPIAKDVDYIHKFAIAFELDQIR